MDCLICKTTISPGETVFWGNEMVCSGLGEYDCEYSSDHASSSGAICCACFKGELREPSIIVVSQEESSVQRTDALSLFDEE